MAWSELHCHSGYSLMDGASMPETLAVQAQQLGYPALALTDHDSLAGIVPHALACARAGIRPIAGVEATIADGSHLTLLARDADGFRSLTRLVSHAHLSGSGGAAREPSLTLDELARYAAGLECLTGCRHAAVPRLLLAGDEAGARAMLGRLRDIFGAGHLWVELQRRGLPDDERLCYLLAREAARLDLHLVATGNSHYAYPTDRPLQDVLVCIRQRRPLSEAQPHLRPGGSWHLPGQTEVQRRFRAYPAALCGAEELADRCDFALSHIDAAFPRFPVPAGHTALSYLRELVWTGAADRYGTPLPEPVRARLAHELGVIAALDKADYFLVVWDIVRYAREQGILCQGRGSAVGSCVCYCLGLTSIEPIGHRLSFERFLSRGRTDPPDVDIDLPADRDDRHGPARDAVIRYALTRWPGHAALACNTVTYQARSAVREVGMALGLPREQLDLLAREGSDLIADGRVAVAKTTERIEEPENEPLPAVLRRLALPPGPVLRRLQHLAQRLIGLPRHLSQHPGGVVITARPLAGVAPLQHARMPGRIIVQWDRDAIEDAGLVKVDLLGLGMLGAIDRAFALLERQTGTRPTLHGFTCDDPRVYDALCAADTVGVFQVESRAQISLCLPQLQPRCFDDIVVAVALIRPGPVQAHAVHPYLRRRQGLEPVTYPGGAAGRRLLEPILAPTLGQCLFQDQVIDIGIAAGLPPDEAAALRRALSGTRPERLATVCRPLAVRLATCGLDEEGIRQVLGLIQTFASYGFQRGHACAFAYLSYVSCWLKVWHPAIFLASLLDMLPMGFYDADTLIQDARRHGVRVLPVDVRYSRADCTIEDGAVRLGLRLIKGLGADACARLDAALGAPPFPATLDALCARARLDEDEARALARSGALGGYIVRRREALWQAPVVARATRERWVPGLREVVDSPVQLPVPSPSDEAALDYAALGLAMSGHPLELLRPQLPASLKRADDLATLRNGSVVEIVGQVISRQRPPTAKGLLFLGVSDEMGLVNVTVPLQVYDRDRMAVRDEAFVWIKAVVERREQVVGLRALKVRPLRDVSEAT